MHQGAGDTKDKANTRQSRTPTTGEAPQVNAKLGQGDSEDAKPKTLADLSFDKVSQKHHAAIRKMIQRHESMWNGALGEISTAEHRIDLTPGARPQHSQPYRAGPKQTELEE